MVEGLGIPGLGGGFSSSSGAISDGTFSTGSVLIQAPPSETVLPEAVGADSARASVNLGPMGLALAAGLIGLLAVVALR